MPLRAQAETATVLCLVAMVAAAKKTVTVEVPDM
jgi:hypothetical protein